MPRSRSPARSSTRSPRTPARRGEGTTAVRDVRARRAPRERTAAETDATRAARRVLADQQAAWNRGDLDAFMDGYWKSGDLRFAGGDAVRTGWQATIDRYRKSYPDAAAMGKLDFELIEVREVTPAYVYVFGRWHLARATNPRKGAARPLHADRRTQGRPLGGHARPHVRRRRLTRVGRARRHAAVSSGTADPPSFRCAPQLCALASRSSAFVATFLAHAPFVAYDAAVDHRPFPPCRPPAPRTSCIVRCDTRRRWRSAVMAYT